jgi:hypothetical protein
MNIAWKKWLAGLWAAISSGVTTAISTNLVAPEIFNVYTRKFWFCAGASAAVSALKYILRTRFSVISGKFLPAEDDLTAADKPTEIVTKP